MTFSIYNMSDASAYNFFFLNWERMYGTSLIYKSIIMNDAFRNYAVRLRWIQFLIRMTLSRFPLYTKFMLKNHHGRFHQCFHFHPCLHRLVFLERVYWLGILASRPQLMLENFEAR